MQLFKTKNHSYHLKWLKNGRPYITRQFTHTGFSKYLKGELNNRSGILF